MEREKLVCDTCGTQVEYLRRDVVDVGYNAFNKPPLWNCEVCYEEKRRRRAQQRQEQQ